MLLKITLKYAYKKVVRTDIVTPQLVKLALDVLAVTMTIRQSSFHETAVSAVHFD